MRWSFNSFIISCIISIVSALWIASIAEDNARLAAADLVLEHRNDVQKQLSLEREEMKEYINKAIDRNRHSLNTGD